MSILESLLREKRLRRNQRLHELALARTRRDASAQELATARRIHAESRAVLWQTMTAEQLCVQRLSLARAQELRARRSMDEATRAHVAAVEQLDTVQRVLARIEKDIEKLEERREQQRSMAAAEALKRQWRELDDWIIGRRMETAG